MPYDMMSVACYNIWDIPKALEILNRALKINPKDARIQKTNRL